LLYSVVPGGRSAAIRLLNQAYARVTDLFDYLGGLVLGAVVHDHEFEIWTSLV